MTKDELIRALEAATGPIDELELALATWCYENGAIGGVNYDPEMWLIRNGGHLSSIDAALSLVPPGAEYSITTLYGVAHVEMSLNDADGNYQHGRREDGNVPLALCIAALRARP